MTFNEKLALADEVSGYLTAQSFACDSAFVPCLGLAL